MFDECILKYLKKPLNYVNFIWFNYAFLKGIPKNSILPKDKRANFFVLKNSTSK